MNMRCIPPFFLNPRPCQLWEEKDVKTWIVKRTVSLIWSDPSGWQCPIFWSKSVYFCDLLYCFLLTRNAQVTFAENPQMKINSLKLQKHWYLIHTWSDNHVFLEWDWDNGIGTIGLGQWDLYQLFPTSFSSRNHCEFLFNSLQI